MLSLLELAERVCREWSKSFHWVRSDEQPVTSKMNMSQAVATSRASPVVCMVLRCDVNENSFCPSCSEEVQARQEANHSTTVMIP